MGTIAKLSRRTFLVASVAVTGGVMFGVNRFKTPAPNPLLDGLGEGEAAITPYVKIDASGITLITPRADKGQGAYSVQAALIAEELDVDLDQIKVDAGVPSAAYWNTGFSAEASEFMVPNGGLGRDVAATVVDAVMKFTGGMVTGGSTTVPDGFVKLRQAGASARETLKTAASQQTGIDISELKTESGAVILPDGTRLPYVELASAAAQTDVVQNVALRDPSEWRIVGKNQQRVDIVQKSTGTLNYGIDFSTEYMKYATVVLNPAQTGPITDFDATEALEIEGVEAVVPVTGGVGIIANNTWTAFQAAKKIKASWGKAPFPDAMDAHWQTLSDSFVDEKRDSRNRDDGDVDEALAGSNDVIASEFRAPYLAHAPLEPISAVVQVNYDSVDVWTGTQVPTFIQTNVSRITSFDKDKINVHVLMMGGSFGHRLEDEVVKQCAEIAMTMKGTPIKLTYSREEDMTHDFTRQIAMARLKGTIKDGHVDTLDLSIAMPSVVESQMARQALSLPGPDSQIVAGAWEQPFDIPNQRVTGYRAPQLAPLSSWRSVGASSNGFFYNAALDELIHAAGADPMDERLRLCSDPLARAVLEAVAEMSNWDGPNIGENRGRGVALTRSFGVPVAEVIDVTNTPSGIKIDNVWVAAEVGTVVDPINFDNLVKGGVIFGLGHAMNCEITYTDGVADQTNFHAYEGMRLDQCPQIEIRGLENGDHVLGIGEPPVPPAAPALAAAIFAATGSRLREMPFNKFVEFV